MTRRQFLLSEKVTVESITGHRKHVKSAWQPASSLIHSNKITDRNSSAPKHTSLNFHTFPLPGWLKPERSCRTPINSPFQANCLGLFPLRWNWRPIKIQFFLVIEKSELPPIQFNELQAMLLWRFWASSR